MARKGALLMVTHDRYFFDRVVNRTLEIDGGKGYVYVGNYSLFLQKREERRIAEASAAQKLRNIYRRELAWISRGAEARRTKKKDRVERFAQIEAEVKNVKTEANLEMSSVSSRLGKTIIELEDIGMVWDGKDYIKDFSYILLRNDRIGIVGPNGAGKSTLMDIIAGKLQPTSGEMRVGQTVKIGYFAQHSEFPDSNMRVLEYIKEANNYIETADGQRISAAQMLERFLFPPELQWVPVSKLSGGEKRRLYLLRVLMTAPNVLLLDEPTNDLDIPTLSVWRIIWTASPVRLSPFPMTVTSSTALHKRFLRWSRMAALSRISAATAIMQKLCRRKVRSRRSLLRLSRWLQQSLPKSLRRRK